MMKPYIPHFQVKKILVFAMSTRPTSHTWQFCRYLVLTLGVTHTSVVTIKIDTVARKTTMRIINTKLSTKANFPMISSQNKSFSRSAMNAIEFDCGLRRHPMSNGVTQAYNVISNFTYGQLIEVQTIRIASAY